MLEEGEGLHEGDMGIGGDKRKGLGWSGVFEAYPTQSTVATRSSERSMNSQ